MNEELAVLMLVSGKLEGAGIPYMITGSVAANFYAVPRMTRDVDMVIEVLAPDANRLVDLFKADFYIDRTAVRQAIDRRGMFNIIHNDSVLKIDFIVRKDAPYRELEFKRRREIQVEGIKLWIVSPEDLILSKLAWAKDNESDVQLRDVKNILSVAETMDHEYLDRWIEALGLGELYSRAKQ